MNRDAPLALLAAVASGALVALQQRINGDLAVSLDDAVLAAVVSFATGLALVLVVVAARPSARAKLPALRSVPWYLRIGGLGGVSGLGAWILSQSQYPSISFGCGNSICIAVVKAAPPGTGRPVYRPPSRYAMT